MHELYSLNRRDKRRRKHWEHLIKEWQASELAQGIFCEHHGLKQTDFVRWANRLQKKQTSKTSTLGVKPATLLDFVPVEIVKESKLTDAISQPVELHHRSGFSFKVTIPVDSEPLHQLMLLLTRLPC